ncbi:hypothetical protein F66182_5833 [Fusarium sp. NRRL 66182]|nr:hypothetical protein F66182_5833 [Fusarium sp. NRRL 66182]
MSSPSWQGITFGVELEFMTPCPSNKHIWRFSCPSAAARINIAERLARSLAVPIACECQHDPDKKCAVCDQIPERYLYGGTRILSFPTAVPNGTMLRDCCFLFKPEFIDRRDELSLQRCWPPVEISSPIFHSGELHAGLPTMGAVLSSIRTMGLNITADSGCGMHVHVGVEKGMTLLLAKKISTLVVLLETNLLLPLVAPTRWNNEYAMPVSERSDAATDPVPQHVDTTLLDQHLPPMDFMQPGTWNNNNVERIYGMLKNVWSAHSLPNLSQQLRRDGIHRCGFTLALRTHQGKANEGIFTENFENSPSTVEFRYSQMTFDNVLLRNWTEIVARIVVLAQADADEYKERVKSILQLIYEAESDGKAAWKLLMRYILKLQHRVPEWEAQLDKFKRGEYISHMDEYMLLISA